jgi:acyl-CoA thioesterase
MKYISGQNEYIQLLGLEFIELEKGHTLARMKYNQALTNPYGFIHGGALYSMADITAGVTACLEGHFVTTISGNMIYHRPADRTEYIYCEVTTIHAGRQVISCEVRLTNDDGKLIDSGSFTFHVTDKEVKL